jgi:hypothetical protein
MERGGKTPGPKNCVIFAFLETIEMHNFIRMWVLFLSVILKKRLEYLRVAVLLVPEQN